MSYMILQHDKYPTIIHALYTDRFGIRIPIESLLEELQL
jgi:hypothetical protein